MVYFIEVQHPDGVFIKIGYAEDAQARAGGIRFTRKAPVRILGIMPGFRRVEASVHQRFAHLRLGRHEHFRPDQELMDFIEENTEPITPRSKGRALTSERSEGTALIETTIVLKAKQIAAYKEITVSELLSELLAGPIDRAYAQMLRELDERGSRP